MNISKSSRVNTQNFVKSPVFNQAIPYTPSHPPLKIGIEAQRIFRAHKHGMDIVALELIKHLQKIDTYNQYFIFVKDDVDTACLPTAKNFEVVSVAGKTYLDWEQVCLPKAIKKTGVELMHFTSNTAPLKCPVPNIITLHDVIFLEKMPLRGTSYQKLGWAYRRWVVPKVIHKSAKVITVSHYEKTQILNKFPNLKNKIDVVHNGVSSEFKTLKSGNYQKLHDQLLPKDFLFFLGNQAPKKNLQNVLVGYAQYVQKTSASLPLVIAETNAKQLEGKLKSLKLNWLAPHIILPGYIPNQQIGQWYNQAKAFLYPSLRESFGLPILEAMACGTPVITSNTSAIPEVANEAALLVDPYNPAKIAQAISKITNDRLVSKALIKRGLINSRQFSWDNHAKKVLQMYQEVAKKFSIMKL